MSDNEPRPRRRVEQELADRFGRAWTEPMPVALLDALVRAEEIAPGRVFELLGETGYHDFARSFWASFWEQFQLAQAAKRGR